LHQAAHGKGKERHAKPGEYFEDQKICEITRRVGLGFALGQAIKKAEEAPGLKHSGGVRELLGAINYLAAGVIIMEEEEKKEQVEGQVEATRTRCNDTSLSEQYGANVAVTLSDLIADRRS
jgi:hypothetical protein